MADVFISYKRENQELVQRIVQALRGAGLHVWWDQDIPPMAPWEETIERELHAAKVTIVAWSPIAVVSENVKAEARWARNEGRLIQVFVEACAPPTFFGERQGVALTGWHGAADDQRFQTVLAAVRAIMEGKTPPQGVGYAPRRGRPAWQWAAGGVAALAVALTLVANAPAARDAVCGLGPLQSTCLRAGLTHPPPAPVDPAVIRARLLHSIEGAWRRPDGSCDKGKALAFELDTDATGVSHIHLSGPNGFKRIGQVVAADGGVIVTQDAVSGDYWKYAPNGDTMTATDTKRTPTSLVRCPAPGPTASP
jgi:hypothetical protein